MCMDVNELIPETMEVRDLNEVTDDLLNSTLVYAVFDKAPKITMNVRRLEVRYNPDTKRSELIIVI